MPRFSAHLGYLFSEHPFDRRFAAARSAGFQAVEHPEPYATPAAALRRLVDQEGLTFVQFALPPGDASKKEKGYAAWPGRQREFRDSVEIGLDYAQVSGARFIQVHSGLVPTDHPPELVWDVYLANLCWASERARQIGVGVLIEPIGPGTLANYFMSRTHLAIEAIQSANCPNLKVLFDIFHSRWAGEDPAAIIRAHAASLGHVHVADFPGRHEPGTGETNFEKIFSALADISWTGFVGCEYAPTSKTEESLGWMHNLPTH
jgi:hydroxypyruvate isomerase